jgi:lipocalin
VNRTLSIALAGGALLLWLSGVAVGGTAAGASTTTTTTVAPPTPGDTWLIRAIGAEAKVGSVRVQGNVNQNGLKFKVDFLVNGDGEGGGTFVQAGSTIQLKLVGTLLYFNAPQKFWRTDSTTGATQAKEYGGKWIEVSALDSRFQSFDQFLNASDLVTAVFQGHTTPLKLSSSTYQGHKVKVVSNKVTVKGKVSSGQMYIAATGTPVVLKIIDRGPTNNSTFTFSDYGKAKSITIPPEPINLT